MLDKCEKCNTIAISISCVIAVMGIACSILSNYLYAQNPKLYAICFDAGVVFALCHIAIIFLYKIGEMNVKLMPLHGIPVFIIYIFYMIFFKKSTVLIDIGLFAFAEFTLLIIIYIYEDKLFHALVDVAESEGQLSLENHRKLVEDVYKLHDLMNKLREKVKDEIIKNTGKIDFFEKKQYKHIKLDSIKDMSYYIPEKPSQEIHYNERVYRDYNSKIINFIYKVNEMNEQLNIKLKVFEQEAENRINQYNYIHMYDEAIERDISPQINNILKEARKKNIEKKEIFNSDYKRIKKISKRKVK